MKKPIQHPCELEHDHEIKINEIKYNESNFECAVKEEYKDRRLYRYIKNTTKSLLTILLIFSIMIEVWKKNL